MIKYIQYISAKNLMYLQIEISVCKYSISVFEELELSVIQIKMIAKHGTFRCLCSKEFTDDR